MKKYDIVILDSGIDDNHPMLRDIPIDLLQVRYNNISTSYEMCEQIHCTYGHGTAIASILAEKNTSQKILSINLLETTDYQAKEDALIYALNYLFHNIEATVINLSIGITMCEDKQALLFLCTQLSKKGFILVAAFDNDGAMSFPAAFQCVIGVKGSDCCYSINDYEIYNDPIINVGAYGKSQRVAWNNGSYMIMGGNSLACAHISKKIMSIYKHTQDRVKILNTLKEHAINIYDDAPRVQTNRNSGLPYVINRAAIFPFNKEMHSLIRFNDLLAFEIVGVYDTKYSMQVGRCTNSILNDNNVKEMMIENIEDIQLDKVDTFILGHIQELAQLPQMKIFLDNLIRQIMIKKINLFTFDYLELMGYKKFFCPYVVDGDMPMRRFGMLYQINKPIIGVFGTSSKQGKFTFQLTLRKLLMNKGYKVGQLGTEPSSLLFGFDEVYPMGYNSSVFINGIDSIIYLNNLMERLENKENDILIVGAQSGTISYAMPNIANCCLSEYEFILGTQPDIVFLCINPFDDIEYIHRTIKFIESSVNCYVQGLIMFPKDRKTNWQGNYGVLESLSHDKFILLKNKLESITNKPVYLLNNNTDMNTVTEMLINSLVEEE